ncbi:MAG: hypothetical protein M9962_15485, partial [Oligoflexia bacterium]|nr:hypothetical protein [Oligoflexia bacterium]
STRVSSGDILRLQANHPEFFRNARHALLLGCYNMTDFNRKKWRHNLFPNASLMAGFGVRAPSRFRPISAQYIKDTLNTANALDDKLSSNRPISLKEINDSFKKLSSVLNTQSVIDYCYSIIEGQPGAAKLECDEQWDTFLGAAEVIEKEYLDLSKPLKEPPVEDANNELRDFYNLLQNTCPAEQTKKYNDRGVAAAERYRSSLKSTTIRMMHWWDIQKNFQSYYRYEIAELTKELKEVGFKIAIPKLDGRASRADFVYAYDTIERIIYKRRRDLEELYYYGRNMSSEKKRKVERDLNIFQNLERKFSIYASLYALKGDVDGHEESGASEIENTLARGEIPFNWISGGAVLRPRRDQ